MHAAGDQQWVILKIRGTLRGAYRGYPPTLGGVLDGFNNGEGENPFLFSLTA